MIAAFILCVLVQPPVKYPKAQAKIAAVQDAACPVTEPSVQRFVPPPPYPKKPGANQFWFGTSKLWTALPVNGVWWLGHYTPTDTSLRQKMLYWSQGYDWRAENPPQLTVSGKRLDSKAPPLATDEHPNAGWTDDQNHAFIVTGINIPTSGCWQIDATYKGDKLSFIVRISSE